MSTAGGFIHPSSLLSPPASSAASSVASSLLPTPRSRPLVSGSAKETGFINYVDRGVQQITRRYAMKHGNEEGEGGSSDLGGYGTFKEAGADIEKLLDVVWVCGTRKPSALRFIRVGSDVRIQQLFKFHISSPLRSLWLPTSPPSRLRPVPCFACSGNWTMLSPR